MRTLYFTSPQPLEPLAESSFLLTPKVCLLEKHLYLEIDKTAKLFGGELGLIEKADALAADLVGDYQLTVTDRPEWAQALARAGQAYLPPEQSLPLLKQFGTQTLLHLGDPQTLEAELPERQVLVTFMRKVGIHTIGQFLQLPVASVNRRFGKAGEILHDWAAGRRQLCLPVFVPVEPIRDYVDADDLHSLDSLLFSLRQILVQVETRLQGRRAAAKAIALTFNLEAHAPITKTLGLTEATQDAQALLRVLKEFLQSFHWESPLVRLEIEIRDTTLHHAGQLSLFDDFESKFHDLAQYVGRLRARLGEDQVGFAQARSSHLAERSFALTWPPPPPGSLPREGPPRPLFLFTPPRPFTPSPQWQLRFSENLLVEWWEAGGSREYFVARNREECLWVYRDTLKEAWFIHGTFD